MKQVCCQGITNRIKHNELYVPFLDYDDISLKKLKKELWNLNMKWNLGWTYVFDSRGDKKHFHVISPVIMSVYDYICLLWDSSCDYAYKRSFFMLKEKTLRISSKCDERKVDVPELVRTFHYPTNRFYSIAHLYFLERFKNAEIPIGVSGFNTMTTPLEFVRYTTKSDG